MLVVVNGKKLSVPSGANVMLLFHVNTHLDSSFTKKVCLQLWLCIPALHRVSMMLYYVCLQQSTTYEENYSAVTMKNLDRKTAVNVCYWLQLMTYSEICSTIPLLSGSYSIYSLRRALLWPYTIFWINSFYVDEVLRHKYTQNRI